MLGPFDQVVWWTSQALDKTNYTHERYTYDVLSGIVSITYHKGPALPDPKPSNPPDASKFGIQIASSSYSILNGGESKLILDPKNMGELSMDYFPTITNDSTKTFLKLVTDKELVVNPIFVSFPNGLTFDSSTRQTKIRACSESTR